MKRKSPLRVVCKVMPFKTKPMRLCRWKPVGELRAAEFVSRRDGSRFSIVHPSTKSRGKWQVSRFDREGPVGDTQYGSLDEALGEVSPKLFKLRNVE